MKPVIDDDGRVASVELTGPERKTLRSGMSLLEQAAFHLRREEAGPPLKDAANTTGALLVATMVVKDDSEAMEDGDVADD